VDEMEDAYPEPTMFGLLPSYGLFIRHAENMQINNITIYLKTGDERPAVAIDDGRNLSFSSLSIENPSATKAVFHCREAENIGINGFKSSGKSNTFIQLEEDSNKKISLMNNDFSNITGNIGIPERTANEVIEDSYNIK
jgi:hypothetical protein